MQLDYATAIPVRPVLSPLLGRVAIGCIVSLIHLARRGNQYPRGSGIRIAVVLGPTGFLVSSGRPLDLLSAWWLCLAGASRTATFQDRILDISLCIMVGFIVPCSRIEISDLTADYTDGADGGKKIFSLNFIRAIRVIRGFSLIFERGHGQLLELPGVWVVSLSNKICFYRPLRWSTRRTRRKRMNSDWFSGG